MFDFGELKNAWAHKILSSLKEREERNFGIVDEVDLMSLKLDGEAFLSGVSDIEFLQKKGLVSFDVALRPGHTVVKITPEGRIWLDIYSMGSAGYTEELVEQVILRILKTRSEEDEGEGKYTGWALLRKKLMDTHLGLRLISKQQVLNRVEYLVGEGLLEWKPLVGGDRIQDFVCWITSRGLKHIRQMENSANLPPEVRLHIDQFESFQKVCKIHVADVIGKLANGRLEVSEDVIQVAIEEILHEPFHKKDWGGETNDLYTSHIRLKGVRLPAAFLLKGPGLKRKAMEIGDCGKNGDQLLKLSQSPAEVFFVQYVGSISEAVITDIRTKVELLRAEGKRAWFCIMDCVDTARLLVAYDRMPA